MEKQKANRNLPPKEMGSDYSINKTQKRKKLQNKKDAIAQTTQSDNGKAFKHKNFQGELYLHQTEHSSALCGSDLLHSCHSAALTTTVRTRHKTH